MKIKIRLRSGRRIEAKAIPTSCPQLFITATRLRDPLKKKATGHFVKDEWSITHRPTGYRVADLDDLEGIKRLAELYAQSSIPWTKLRSTEDARKYSKEHQRVQRKFWSEFLSSEEAPE